MITPIQKATIQAIVNVFETGTVQGDYSSAICVQGDRGGLTYGRSQTTRASGNLYLLVRDYCNAPMARYAAGLRPYQDRLKACDASLDHEMTLRGLLKQAGKDDPVMRTVQDAFFDRVYWQPAVNAATARGFQTALGIATVYDGTVHGSWQRMAERTDSAVGTLRAFGERDWVARYVDIRRKWLASCPAPLPQTVYRMDTFKALIAAGNWVLTLPLKAHGETITLEAMGISPDWTLFLDDKPVGVTWQNPQDDFRNYIPVRTLLEAKFHEKTAAALEFSRQQGMLISWEGKPLNIPCIVREDGQAWGQVRALATWLNLTVDRDVEKRTVLLHS